MQPKSNFDDINYDSQYGEKDHIRQESSNSILEEICQTLEKLRDQESIERSKIKFPNEKIAIYEDLSHKNNYFQNNFAFEPLLDHESLNLQIGKKSQRGSYTFSTLAAFLTRHKVINALGESLEDLETEQSIQQNVEFLKFLKRHQPFKTGADEKLLRNQDIFKHLQLFDLISSNVERIDDTKIQSKIISALKFCKEEMTFTEDPGTCEKIDSGLSFLSINSQKKLEHSQLLETELESLSEICDILLSQLQKKIEFMNTHSFYYIKMQIEELYSLAGPGHKLKTHDPDAIRYFAKNAFEAMKQHESLCEDSDSFQDIEENGYDVSNPKKIWVTIINCYYDFICELRLSLLDSLSRGHDDETKEFFKSLLEHPLSFFASKEILDVNWNRVDDLITLYEQPVANSGQTFTGNLRNPFNKMLSEMNLFCVDVSLRFEFIGDKKDDHSCKYFTLEPVTCGESLEPNSLIYTINSDSEEFPKKICSKIIRKIKQHIKVFKKQESQEKRVKINKLEIDFYSTHYNEKLYENIEDELKKQISENKYVEQHLGDTTNQIIECFFSYTVKEIDDDSDSMNDKGNNEVEEKCRKVSLFNYDYLREVLLKKHIGNLKAKKFCVLQEEIQDLSPESKKQQIPKEFSGPENRSSSSCRTESNDVNKMDQDAMYKSLSFN